MADEINRCQDEILIIYFGDFRELYYFRLILSNVKNIDNGAEN